MERHNSPRRTQKRRVRRWTISFLLLSLTAGCPRAKTSEVEPAQPQNAPAAATRLIVVDDESLAEAASRQWSARSESPLEITLWTGAQLSDALENETDFPADAIIYPSHLLGDFVAGDHIAPVPDYVSGGNFAGDDFSRNDWFPIVRNTVMQWGQTSFALSFGQPVYVLGYRPQILELVGANPPTTWEELGALIQKIDDFDFSTSDVQRPEFVFAQPLGETWAAESLLARAVASAKSRARFSTLFDLRSMDAMIGTPPFVASLNSMLKDQQRGSQEAFDWTPCDSMKALHSGRCALALGWPCMPHRKLEHSNAGDDGLPRVLMTTLPGSRRVFSVANDEWQVLTEGEPQRVTYVPAAGRCGSVLKRSRRQRAAWGLLVRLTGREWGYSVASASRSSTVFRHSQGPQIDRWLDESWLSESAQSYEKAVSESLLAELLVCTPRLQRHQEYRKALAAIVRGCLKGESSAIESLQRASDEWDQISRSTDAKVLSDAYHQSLGLEP